MAIPSALYVRRDKYQPLRQHTEMPKTLDSSYNLSLPLTGKIQTEPNPLHSLKPQLSNTWSFDLD